MSGYNSENEKSSDILKLYSTDKGVNHGEIEDMKALLFRAKERDEKAKRQGVLKEPEVSNYYKLIKATPEQYSRNEISSINKKSWLTLEYLMSSLNLSKEFEILFESHSAKLRKDE